MRRIGEFSWQNESFPNNLLHFSKLCKPWNEIRKKIIEKKKKNHFSYYPAVIALGLGLGNISKTWTKKTTRVMSFSAVLCCWLHGYPSRTENHWSLNDRRDQKKWQVSFLMLYSNSAEKWRVIRVSGAASSKDYWQIPDVWSKTEPTLQANPILPVFCKMNWNARPPLHPSTLSCSSKSSLRSIPASSSVKYEWLQHQTMAERLLVFNTK